MEFALRVYKMQLGGREISLTCPQHRVICGEKMWRGYNEIENQQYASTDDSQFMLEELASYQDPLRSNVVTLIKGCLFHLYFLKPNTRINDNEQNIRNKCSDQRQETQYDDDAPGGIGILAQ